MCPKTLDIVSRTACIGISMERTKKRTKELAKKIRKAAGN